MLQPTNQPTLQPTNQPMLQPTNQHYNDLITARSTWAEPGSRHRS